MAMKKNIETNFGFEIQNAYIRVESVRIEKNKIQFQVRKSVDGIKPHFSDTSYECAYALDGDNPIKQAYTHLKTLPEFSGAIDC
jgi:hypothetical protein